MRAPDALFADPWLAAVYDDLDGDRDDLDGYLQLTAELGAGLVVDVGCGTGSLAVRLAAAGLRVVGVDPARASLDVARAKPGADRVTWVDGDATALTDRVDGADLVLMTGNVAQVFVDDVDWQQTLAAAAGVLRDGGWLALETRRPEARAWERWDLPPTVVELASGGTAVMARVVTAVDLPLVTFAVTVTLDGVPVTSTSTLRFRGREEVGRDLAGHGLVVEEVREAPDRPGRELVILARRVEGQRRQR